MCIRDRVGAEARLGNAVIRQLQGQFGRSDRVAAMSNVGKGAAMHESRCILQCLYQVGFQRVL